jgi:hypothetical protein
MRFSYSFQLPANEEDRYEKHLYRLLSLKEGDLKDIRITKKSIDARKKPEVYYSFTVSFSAKDDRVIHHLKRLKIRPAAQETKYSWPKMSEVKSDKPPVIVGFGPAGMFAALYLARAGLKPIILERGSKMEERISAVNAFHKGGELKPNTNVQFGEGGAGTFSDGKLNTGVKDKAGRNEAVLRAFHEFGADLDITYDGRAHMGTDVIRKVVVNIRKEIERLGGTILFDTTFIRPEIQDGRVTGIYYLKNDKEEYLATNALILAIGHSSRDTYETLHKAGFSMEAKSFAVGFRVLHDADFINESQYGRGYKEKYPNLPTAYYKLARTTSLDRNVYSFCMCPGGVVVNASSEDKRLCINGMSNKAREGRYSNAAIVMNVGPKDFEEYGFDGVLAGMEYQRKLEEKAFILGNGLIPVQFYQSFKNNESDTVKNDQFVSMVKEGLHGNAIYANLRELFTESMNDAFVEGMEYFNTCIKGYTEVNPLLAGVEARTSAPIRILRGDDFQSLSAKGLFPCGEGAGYAGGIMSAAMDGLKVAEKVVECTLT